MKHVPHLVVRFDRQVGVLTDTQRSHLSRVLRIAEGGTVSYTDGSGIVGEGRYEFGVVVRGDETQVERPLPRVTLAVAPPRSTDRLRFLVEKVVELGVDEIIWVRTQYGEGRVPSRSKLEAWTNGAVEQSRSGYVPIIGAALRPISDLGGTDTTVVADQAGSPLDGGDPRSTLTILIGPEGGWGPMDGVDGYPKVRFSHAVLRTETAAIAALAILRSRAS